MEFYAYFLVFIIVVFTKYLILLVQYFAFVSLE